jgi:hypothetical protein
VKGASRGQPLARPWRAIARRSRRACRSPRQGSARRHRSRRRTWHGQTGGAGSSPMVEGVYAAALRPSSVVGRAAGRLRRTTGKQSGVRDRIAWKAVAQKSDCVRNRGTDRGIAPCWRSVGRRGSGAWERRFAGCQRGRARPCRAGSRRSRRPRPRTRTRRPIAVPCRYRALFPAQAGRCLAGARRQGKQSAGRPGSNGAGPGWGRPGPAGAQSDAHVVGSASCLLPGSIIRTAGRGQREHLAQWCPTPATRWWRPFVGGLHTGRGAGRSGGPDQPGSFGLARCPRLLARVRPGPAVAARAHGARRWSPGRSRP